MTRGHVAPLAIPAIALALASASPARAQSSASISAASVSQADALFTDGKALRDARKYPEACAKFAESDRLAPGIGVALYLADCYEHIGKTASAWVSFRSAEKRARERKDERAQVASERAKTLEPNVSRVTFAVARSLHRWGVEVWLDDAGPIPPAAYSLGVAADPGDHVVALKFGGRTVRTVTAHVNAGGTATSVALLEPPLPPIPHDLPAPAPMQSGGDAPSTPNAERSGIGDACVGIELGLVGVGAAGIAVGAGFLVAKDQSMTNGGPNAGPSFDQGASAASAVGFALGGAALATAVVLYLTAPKRSDAAKAPLVLAPLPLFGGGGATLEARF
jgi:hypothetical protein